MSIQLADPHQGMVSFQQALLAGIVDIHQVKPHSDLYSHFDVPGIVDIHQVKPHSDLYSHFDMPAPGVNRLTYVRLSNDCKIVTAFLSCIMNGEVNGIPCVSLGYAVPETMRSLGNAKAIMRDVIKDQVTQSKRSLYFETVVGVDNIASQRVSESILEVLRQEIIDSASKLLAYRYAKLVDCILT